MKYNKIYIMVPPGSGKSTLASKISSILKIKNFDLDDIKYRIESFHEISPISRNEKLKEILKSNSWIIEGSYAHPWIEPAIRQSNLVIIIKPAIFSNIMRLISRYIKRKLGKDKALKGAESLYDLKKLFGYARTYKNDYFLKHKALAEKYKKPLIILTNNTQLNEFINNLKKN